MATKRYVSFFLLVVLCVFMAHAALADEVRMKNGDRLTGTIVRMEKGQLFFKTDYAQETIALSWTEVDCLTSSGALPVRLNDDNVLIGNFVCAESGKLRIESQPSGKTTPTTVGQIQSVNPSRYSGLLSLGGSVNSGNSDTKALNATTRIQAKTQRHRFTVDAKFNYGEADGKTSARNSLGSLKYDYFTTAKLYGYLQSLTEQDTFANLRLRYTEGLGLGYQFFDDTRLSLFGEAGVSYFNEDVMVGKDKHEAAGRWSAGLEWEALPGRLTLFHRQEGYYSVTTGTVVLLAEQGVRVPLFEGLSANFQADYRYNSNPEAGKKRSDLGLILGLTYQYSHW